jgi:putative ABC transport system permease protein
VRTEARASFASTISGTDLIVGARSGSVNLLLYSVFRIGNATNNIRWESFEHFAEHPQSQLGHSRSPSATLTAATA